MVFGVTFILIVYPFLLARKSGDREEELSRVESVKSRGRSSRCCGLVFVCIGLGRWGEITYGLRRQPEAHCIC